MFDTPLRRFKDRIGSPLAVRMDRVSPIFISTLGFAVGLFAAYAAFKGQYLLAFGFWILNRTLDGFDGLLARLHGKQSDFGGYVDILTDFIVYASLPIGLVAGSPSNERYLALAFMLASFYVNSASWMYLAGILEKRAAHSPDPSTRLRQSGQAQTAILMPAGLIGGFETLIAFCIFILFPAHLTTLYTIFTVLVVITTIQRLIWAKRILIEKITNYQLPP